MLALVPTVISLVTMTMAVHAIGSTPTAIMGALEPLTAVIIGVTVFGEVFTLRLGIGIFMILVAVILIVAAKSNSSLPVKLFLYRTCCAYCSGQQEVVGFLFTTKFVVEMKTP